MVTGEEHKSVLLGTLCNTLLVQFSDLVPVYPGRARAVGRLSQRKTKFHKLKVRKTHHRVCVVSSSGTVANELRIRPQIANLDL